MEQILIQRKSLFINRISLFEVYPENWVELLKENNDDLNADE